MCSMREYQRLLSTSRYAKNLVHKQGLHATFGGYAKEETLASNIFGILELSKPDANDPAKKVEETGRIEKKSPASTPLQKRTKTKKILQNKVENVQQAQKK